MLRGLSTGVPVTMLATGLEDGPRRQGGDAALHPMAGARVADHRRATVNPRNVNDAGTPKYGQASASHPVTAALRFDH